MGLGSSAFRLSTYEIRAVRTRLGLNPKVGSVPRDGRQAPIGGDGEAVPTPPPAHARCSTPP
eukprot:15227425-Alexandrium_andersonii.AAC.1